MSRWNAKLAKFSFSRLRPLTRYQARNNAPERERRELTGGNAAHAEFRQAEQAEAKSAADHDLHRRDTNQHDRRHAHVAGAAHDRGERVDKPDRDCAGEQHLRIVHRLFEHLAAAAEQGVEVPAERQHHRREEQAGAGADDRGMQRKVGGALAVSGAERAAQPRRRRRRPSRPPTSSASASRRETPARCRRAARRRGGRYRTSRPRRPARCPASRSHWAAQASAASAGSARPTGC